MSFWPNFVGAKFVKLLLDFSQIINFAGIFQKSRSAENEYENGKSEKENGYDTKRNILRKIILRSRK